MQQVVFARPKVYTRQRACGAVVRLPSWRPPARVRFPVWDRSGVAPGIFPRGVPGCVCACVGIGVWCVCMCKPRQARPRTSPQPICVERAVSVGAQLEFLHAGQCSRQYSNIYIYIIKNLLVLISYHKYCYFIIKTWSNLRYFNFLKKLE